MKAIGIVASLGLSVVASAPALAGSPDNPGIAGQAVSELAQQTNAQSPGAFGKGIAGASQNGDKLGPAVQAVKSILGGSPNSGNDHGGGNDDDPGAPGPN